MKNRFPLLGLLAAISIALLITSCTGKTSSRLKVSDLSWLEGRWITEDLSYIETWRMSEESMLGSGITITDGDTVFSERLTINRNEGILTYWALVAGQNNDQPVGFDLTTNTPDSLVFENDGHDFPNRLTYVKVGNTGIFIRVENYSGEKGFNIELHKTK